MINDDTHTGPSFSFGNRLARFIWNIVNLLFFRFSPVPFFAWRSFLLRCFGATIGKNTHIYPGVKIWAPWNINIGDECGIASGVKLYSQGFITIGKRTVISQGTNLCAGTHDYKKPGFPLVIKPIHIGDYVWIAAEAFVHPGVQINNGCVIGARAVVTTNMPEWMVCTGHPCKPVKTREMENTYNS